MASALAAAVINEAIRWGAIAAMRLIKRQLPVLDVGLFLLPIIGYAAYRRWTPASAARRADARLGLDDRLASFVDFAQRDNIPAAVREAQARETRLALAGSRPAAATPIRGWLTAGPLLLLASLAYPLFLGTGPVTTTTLMLRQMRSGFERGGIQGQVSTSTGEGDRPADAGGGVEKSGGAPPPGTEKEPSAKQEDAAPRAEDETGTDVAAKALDENGGKGAAAAPEDEAKSARVADHSNTVQMEQLVSEQVGRALTKVVDPVFSPDEDKPQPPEAAGSITVDLVPRGRTRAGGGTPGEGTTGRRIPVDLSTLPEQYRPLVKTYFELLAAGGQDGDPPTTRSDGP